MKRLLSLLLTVALMISVICAAAVTTAQAAVTEVSVNENIDKIRLVGRAFAIDSGIACDCTASGIEFTAECEGDVALTIQAKCVGAGSGSANHDNNKDCYYTVYVDGVRKDERLRIMSGTQTVTFATGLESGTHTFKIVKQSEGGLAQTVIESITLNGTLGNKPADPEYVFEFIGDSITSGFGSLGTNNPSARYSDGTRTYAYVTAENFGAEARVTSRSGATITAAYNFYKQADEYRTGMGDYQFDMKKPNAVVIALGTNDGAKTVEYWQTNLQKFMDLIRGGYNDYTIPFVFAHNIMSNGDTLRINVYTAFENLKKLDPEKYSYTYLTNGSRSGGHPNQNGHLFAAKKLTQCMVNNGIMPIEALKSDATVILTPTEQKSVSINKFDSASGLTIPSGITYEAVDALDPADADDSTAKAAKFTADGTQTDTRIKLDTSSIKADGFRIKGISMYVNYKDTADYTDVENPTKTLPKLYLFAGDKRYTQPLNAVDGETSKVELTWDNMGETNFVFIHILMNSGFPAVYLEFSTDTCEYTIDNMEVMLFDYAVTDNANATYKALSSFPMIGVTDNYDIPSATTATTTSSISDLPKTYKTLFDADSDANAVTYTGSGLKSGSLGITDKEGLQYNTETGSAKLLKYMTAGAYNNPQIVFSGDAVNKMVQNSVGVRVWVAADKASAAGGRSGIAFQFYDSVNNKTYFAGQWGSTKVSLDTTGKWYTLYWDDFSTTNNKLAIGAAGGTVSANSIYKNITKITVSSGVNGNGSWASLVDNNIYIDDLQFIYAGGSGETETTLPGGTTTTAVTAATTLPTTGSTTAAPTTVPTTAPTTVLTTVAPTTTIAPTTTAVPTTTLLTVVTTENTTVATEPTTVKPIIYGDSNGDGKINLLDLIAMRKHLAKWSISIDEAAADCNADGKINLLDLILMRKYLAKWNVVLGVQPK